MSSMVDALRTIYAEKALRLVREQQRESYDELRYAAISRVGERRSLLDRLRASDGAAIVAEIKRASPSAGIIVEDFDPGEIARTYEAGGAVAISVLTEETRFGGDVAHLDAVRRVTSLPLLRKDFMWTRYHMAQSAAYGADCVLLIVAGIDDAQLRECLEEARRYHLDALVEVHDEAELRRALDAGASFVGVNNRNLRTLTVDLAVGERLLREVPPGVISISESGIRDRWDLARMRAAGARGFLIGESLMRAADPRRMLENLRS